MSLLSQLPRRRADATPTLVMVIVCAGVVLASLDLFIVNVALPDIARDLHTKSLSSLSWILNAYAIVYASMLVLLGRLSESHRRENGFLLGVALFTIASAACGLADDLAMLVVFRIVQAIGAALLTPTSLSLVLATTSPERRHGAVRAWTAIGGLAAALGPVVGGLLVAASWRWVFLVNVPIGVAAVVVGWRHLPRVEGHPVPRPDALGAVLVTVGVAALTLGLVKGNDWGWGSPATVVSLIGAVIALALFALHCARRVAAMESYMGFVEVGVGLLPAGGGLTYIARRAAEMAAAGNANGDLFPFLRDAFTSAATARVGTSANENRKLGFLLWSDVVVAHKGELLHVASTQIRSMFESGYRPPMKTTFPVAGRNAIATIKGQLVNMRDGGFISAHDFDIAALIADVVCGGDVDAGSLVTEEYLMALERKHFCGLLDHPKTQERIMGMLQTGKPIRN